ncbi:MAG: altronate dehydratase family protein [Bacteroidota bacterium]
MNHKAITIHENDNVAVALSDLAAGDTVSVNEIPVTLKTAVSAKHKFTLKELRKDEEVIMYGVVVGKTTCDIKKGEVIATTNVQHSTAKVSGKKGDVNWTKPDVSKWKGRQFMGFKRNEGQVGTQNIWLFFPLVFCENKNIETLKETFEKELGYAQPTEYQQLLRSVLQDELADNSEIEAKNTSPLNNIELKFITHNGGCGSTRQDAEELSRLLAGYLNNPNVAGATVLSLGCQNLEVELFRKSVKAINPDFNKPLLIYDQQELGTKETMLNQAILESMYAILLADKQEREPASLTNLTIGLECGGSDGFSGISANPVLGYVSDIIVALGGAVMLGEFPELCGAEQNIVDRCANPGNATKFLNLMSKYENDAKVAGSGFDMNPSPGNIKDGLITDAMKSAGAARKAGSSPVISVLDYGEYVNNKGLSLVCTPGNDVESTTILAGAGANIILFTTGLGTPTGNAVSPVIKVSSNSELAERMDDIIDLDAGPIITGVKTIAEVGDELIELILEIASGTKNSKATLNNQNDFIPWRRGISL